MCNAKLDKACKQGLEELIAADKRHDIKLLFKVLGVAAAIFVIYPVLLFQLLPENLSLIVLRLWPLGLVGFIAAVVAAGIGMVAAGERLHGLELMENSGLILPVPDPENATWGDLSFRSESSRIAQDVLAKTVASADAMNEPILPPREDHLQKTLSIVAILGLLCGCFFLPPITWWLVRVIFNLIF